MIFFARRMLEAEPKAEYADILEKELYNGPAQRHAAGRTALFLRQPAGGRPRRVRLPARNYRHVLPVRPQWYACACCPPNVARTLTSLGQYAWGENADTVYAHLFLGGRVRCQNARSWPAGPPTPGTGR